jgi:hypothetical protein
VDVVISILSGEGIRRLIYLISLTLFRYKREYYNSCNTGNVDYVNKATRFILRFIMFFVKRSELYLFISEINFFSTT